MFRISKLADYATAVMVYLAGQPSEAHNAKDIAAHTRISLPTVSKLLKTLTKSGLLQSQRGASGGYTLARPAETISIAEIVTALDGDIAITECNQLSTRCLLETSCVTRHGWQLISRAFYRALHNIKLNVMAQPTQLATLKIEL